MYSFKRIILVIVLLQISKATVYSSSFHIGPIESGIGSWINFPVNQDLYTAYNKLSIDSYFSYGKWQGYISAPLQYTLAKDTIKNAVKKEYFYIGRVAPGDLNFYAGYRFIHLEPRIGITVPLGYPTNSGVWLGSKNIILRAGTGFSGNLCKKLSLKLGGEIYFKYYIFGFPEIKDAQGKRGSWSVEPNIKFTIHPRKKWTFSIETLGGFKKLYPTWLRNTSFQGYELSSSIVPHVSMSYDVKSNLYLSVKAGFGPNFKSKIEYKSSQPWKKTGYSLNIGTGIGFYP